MGMEEEKALGQYEAVVDFYFTLQPGIVDLPSRTVALTAKSPKTLVPSLYRVCYL